MHGSLDSLNADSFIGSREGVSIDYTAQIRVHVLTQQATVLVRQTQFADAKAATMLAFAGVVASRVALDLPRAGLGLPELALLALKALVVASCLLTLMPRYPRRSVRNAVAGRERFSWVALSAPELSADAYVGFMQTAQVSQLIVSLARMNHAVAGTLSRKFQFLRVAFLLGILDVAATAAYYLDGVALGPL